ncbi:LexA family protein [Sphingomonas sp.]|uniref:LexA family protein n=1 Tax=Sphingomonas sp. TaxID=28214 RepID=UPI0035A8CFB8
MERNADDRREILRRFIVQRGLRIAAWAKQAGVDKNSIYNFLNGHSQALDPRTYAKLARVVEIPAWQISGDTPEAPSPTSIWVVGYVEAGVFREAVEWESSQWRAIDVPVPSRFQHVSKALEVRGRSMDLEYPEGSVVIWVDIINSRAPVSGDHVIAYAYAKDGSVEATVKELRVNDDQVWLWPKSSSPDHQVPINVTEPPEGVSTIEIKGLVVGGYRARIL